MTTIDIEALDELEAENAALRGQLDQIETLCWHGRTFDHAKCTSDIVRLVWQLRSRADALDMAYAKGRAEITALKAELGQAHEAAKRAQASAEMFRRQAERLEKFE